MNESQAVPASVSNTFQSTTASVSKKEKEKDEKDHCSNNVVLLLIDIACRINSISMLARARQHNTQFQTP